MRPLPRDLFLSLLLTVLLVPSTWAQKLVVPGVLRTIPPGQCIGIDHPWMGWYMVENLGPFVLGDTVIVVSELDGACSCDGENAYRCLQNNTITTWRNFDFGCGSLYVDEEWGCATVYSQEWGFLAVDHAHGFEGIDSVRVVGNMDLDGCTMIVECGADICVFDRTLSGCSFTPPATITLTWGRVRWMYGRAGSQHE